MKSQVFICIISSGAASRFAGVMFVTTAGQIFKIFIQFVTYKWFHAIVAVAGSMHLWHLRTNVKALMQMRQKWEEKWRCHHTSCLFRFSATKLHSRVLSSQLLFSDFQIPVWSWLPRTLLFSIVHFQVHLCLQIVVPEVNQEVIIVKESLFFPDFQVSYLRLLTRICFCRYFHSNYLFIISFQLLNVKTKKKNCCAQHVLSLYICFL